MLTSPHEVGSASGPVTFTPGQSLVERFQGSARRVGAQSRVRVARPVRVGQVGEQVVDVAGERVAGQYIADGAGRAPVVA